MMLKAISKFLSYRTATYVLAPLSAGLLLHSPAHAQSCAVTSQCYYDCYACDQTSLPALESAIESTVDAEHNTTQTLVTDEHTATKDHVTLSHSQLRVWLSSELHISTGSTHLQDMASQLHAISSASVRSIGTFFDAQNHIQSQNVLNRLSAQAHKDYLPSVSVCAFGTSSRRLATAESKVDHHKSDLSQRYIARITGERGSSGASANVDDIYARVAKFKNTYCDPQDHMGLLGDNNICATGGQMGRLNNDLRYSSLVNDKLTLAVNFTDGVLTKDEEDILSLSNNLYSHRLLSRPKDTLLSYVDNKKIFMHSRELFAKKSITNNTLNSIIALKVPHDQGSTEVQSGNQDSYLDHAYEEMGFDADETKILLGTEPSYYAQMEVLSKKLYQNPAFYTNLLDTPASVERQQAMMQAIELMQSRDLYDSLIRSEMMLSVLLETSMRGAKNTIDYSLQTLEETE